MRSSFLPKCQPKFLKSQWHFIFTTKERASDFKSDLFFYFRSWGTIMVQHCILITVLYCSQLVLGTPLDLLALQNSNENQEVWIILLILLSRCIFRIFEDCTRQAWDLFTSINSLKIVYVNIKSGVISLMVSNWANETLCSR